ncbi:helix-turn-helix transcriptional regulator [Pseudomaricurvus alkylphenolicus]|uniref:helix-turn-helix transcriptional regulator n=1 Tax=Pseudomaricurvus alkylphenolicus TaxID=1306991 RepID=UPI00142433A2|nr:helix-turn-helix transcriptional regulator [Pseudomaricurvus alkylphenolicus]NIB38326.1 helix-turn-helix transcriptional regulator [Pseudomaricurvus alkylphenolicus]
MSFKDIDQFSEITACLYRGTLEHPPWKTFLSKFRKMLNSQLAVLTLRPPSPDDPGLLLLDRDDESDIDSNAKAYANEFYAFNPFTNLPPGEVVTLDEHVDHRVFFESDYYQNFLHPAGVHQIMGLELVLQNQVHASLHLTRSEEMPTFNEEEKQKVRQLIIHLEHALTIHSELNSIESERSLYDQTVARLNLGIILIDSKLRVVRVNEVAEQLLDNRPDISIRDNKLSLADYTKNKQLRNILTAALETQKSGEPHVTQALCLDDDYSGGAFHLVIRPAQRLDWSENQDDPAIVISLSDLTIHTDASLKLLKQLFQITPAEGRVALKLANGLSLDEACEALDIRRTTARAHLRSIYSKTGVARQNQLVSLILRSLAALSGAEGPSQ